MELPGKFPLEKVSLPAGLCDRPEDLSVLQIIKLKMSLDSLKVHDMIELVKAIHKQGLAGVHGTWKQYLQV